MGRWAVMALALVACGGGDNANVATVTLGEACTELSQAACQRASECLILGGATIGTCESQFVVACCVGPPNTCSKKASNPTALRDYIDTCASALSNFDCATLGQGGLPLPCLSPMPQ